MNRKGIGVVRAFGHMAVLALTLGAFAPVAFASAEPQNILFAAIRNGTASDTMSGKVADYFMQKTHSTSPILVTAKVISRFPIEKDCARLSITMHQENVPKKDGTFGPWEFTYQMNLCTDGLPPSEGADWSTAPVDPSGVRPEDIR